MPLSAEFGTMFLEEASRHLEQARRRLEGLLDDETRESALVELYRHLHSVKGMAATLGRSDMATRAHEIEESVEAAREGRRRADPTLVTELEKGLARLAKLLERAPSPSLSEPTSAHEEGGLALRLPPARIDAERLDQLVRHVTTLVSSHQRLEHQLGPPEDGRALQTRHRLTSALRGVTRQLLELRLVPVSTLAPLLQSAVRRWAGSSGVHASLRLLGEDVHVERGLVESLFDPLGQLVRNALVHGIENPEEREALGKTRDGVVVVAFARRAGRLRVTVRDDGRGLDPDAVLRRARFRGIVREGEGPALAHERLMLLTDPRMGSSAQDADLLRGRGVGLGTARASIEELGGRFRLESARGEGFSVHFSLPSRRALQHVFLVRAGGRRFALPLAPVSAVRRCEDMPALEAIPTLSLARVLGLPSGPQPDRHALVIETGSGPEALTVTSVDERRELLVESLGPPLEATPPWNGAAPLAEGGLVLVLDPLAALGRDDDDLGAYTGPLSERQ